MSGAIMYFASSYDTNMGTNIHTCQIQLGRFQTPCLSPLGSETLVHNLLGASPSKRHTDTPGSESFAPTRVEGDISDWITFADRGVNHDH